MKNQQYLQEMQQLAQARGGRCLTEDYQNSKQRLLWQCAEGHQWQTTLGKIRLGRWCPTCYRLRVGQIAFGYFDKLKALAHEKGGQCLTEHYVDAHSKMEWQCAEGHRWWSAGSLIKQGHWCPQCHYQSRRLSDEIMHQLARERGGRCLSDEYQNAHQKLTWQCAEGHEWQATLESVRAGHWCRMCARGSTRLKQQQAGLEQARALAEQQGEQCLSERYVNSASKLDWQCAHGHVWQASMDVRRQGQGCPHCVRAAREQPLQRVQRLAAEHGGLCLTTEYQDAYQLFEWQCAQGHRWSSPARSVRAGRWCRVCASQVLLPPAQLQALAAKHGGQCLTSEHLDAEQQLEWQCDQGHRWLARASSVALQGRWCPLCQASHTRHDLASYQQLAQARGGRCLSEVYVNSNVKLRWQCTRGHEWEAVPSQVRRGRWCPHCFFEDQRVSKERLHELAAARGGRCLTTERTDGLQRLEWECANGHRWLARLSWIVQGHWCRQCVFDAMRHTLEMYQQIARDRGGACLSEVYEGSRSKLVWQCHRGHVWSATPGHIKHGTWCPECAILNQATRKSAKLKRLAVGTLDGLPGQDPAAARRATRATRPPEEPEDEG